MSYLILSSFTTRRSVKLLLKKWNQYGCLIGSLTRPKYGNVKFPRLLHKVLCLLPLSISGHKLHWKAFRRVHAATHNGGNKYSVSRIENKLETNRPQQCSVGVFLLRLLKPDIILLLLSVTCVLLSAYLNVALPLAFGGLVNEVAFVRGTNDLNDLKNAAAKVLYQVTMQALTTFCYISLLSVTGERVASRLRKTLFTSLLRQDISFFDSRNSGELCSRIVSDVQTFKSTLKQLIGQGLKSSAQLIGSAISLYLISPRMATVALTSVPLVIGLGSILGTVLRSLSSRVSDQVARVLAISEEALGNVKTVRAFAMEEEELKKFAEESEETCRLNIMLGCGIGAFQGAVNFFVNGIVLGVIFGGALLISREELSHGDLMSFMATTQTAQKSLAQLSVLIGQAIQGFGALSRVLDYVESEPTITSVGGLKVPPFSCGMIEFKDVDFAYPSRPNNPVLRKFSLCIPQGKVVALVGPSGAGKSTVAALLERFYDVDSGCIMVGGIDLREVDLNQYRGHLVGFIPQEPVLFSGTIMENIGYGKAGSSTQAILDAAKKAYAHDFIQELPNGYNTHVGEKGKTLSGGQKQRVAIARALIKEPEILILDEATSALDYQSEKMVKEALEVAMKGRTVVIIAHRLSTVQKADIIVVLENGSIVEKGSHKELLRQKGVYSSLVKNQEVLK